jgi:DNA modification methylase
MKIETIKIEKRKISDLIRAEYNPRKITKVQLQDLKEGIEEFGLVSPIVVNELPERYNVIIGGHQRLKILEDLGYTEVDCSIVSLPLDKERKLNIKLNKNGGSFDDDLLKEYFDYEELTEWGFTPDELFGHEEKTTDGLIDDDEIPEAKESRVVLGDIWKLGEHRIMCGDSTSSDDVAKLMNGEKADMVFTDPPYGMNAVSKSGVLSARYKNDILGDDNTDVAKDSFSLIHSLYDCKQIWWGANYYSEFLPSAEGWIVWDKNNGGSDQTDCELAWTNFRSVCRLYKKASEKTNRVHPTQKPVELFLWSVEKFKVEFNIVLDVFLGSGSTLIAAEKLNRKCYGMELDEKYCDVIIERWEQFTGLKAEKLNE